MTGRPPGAWDGGGWYAARRGGLAGFIGAVVCVRLMILLEGFAGRTIFDLRGGSFPEGRLIFVFFEGTFLDLSAFSATFSI